MFYKFHTHSIKNKIAKVFFMLKMSLDYIFQEQEKNERLFTL